MLPVWRLPPDFLDKHNFPIGFWIAACGLLIIAVGLASQWVRHTLHSIARAVAVLSLELGLTVGEPTIIPKLAHPFLHQMLTQLGLVSLPQQVPIAPLASRVPHSIMTGK